MGRQESVADAREHLLAEGFRPMGWLRGSTYDWHEEPPSVPGVYVMLLEDVPFNIGQGDNVARAVKRYGPWLNTTYTGAKRRYEHQRQRIWRHLVGDRPLELLVRASAFDEGGKALNEAEEAELNERYRPQWNRRPHRGLSEEEFASFYDSPPTA